MGSKTIVTQNTYFNNKGKVVSFEILLLFRLGLCGYQWWVKLWKSRLPDFASLVDLQMSGSAEFTWLFASHGTGDSQRLL